MGLAPALYKPKGHAPYSLVLLGISFAPLRSRLPLQVPLVIQAPSHPIHDEREFSGSGRYRLHDLRADSALE